MNILVLEHRELLYALLDNGVSFIVIGGHAVVYYGYERVTADMDIWLQPDNENRSKFLKALQQFGIEDEDINKLSQTDFTIPQVFFFGQKPKRIDFLTKVTGVTFEEAAPQVRYFKLDNRSVAVIQYHHLIATKSATGRAKDKADIEELQRINKYNADR